jgi:hypothetical protein
LGEFKFKNDTEWNTRMPARRRTRRPHPLATPAGVRALLAELRVVCPAPLPKSEADLIRMIESARNVERRPDADPGRGRPRRWSRDDVVTLRTSLLDLLARQPGGPVTLANFVGQYLRILRYPTDITSALEKGRVTVQEAALLARLTPEKLDLPPVEAKTFREDLLKAHDRLAAPRSALRKRVQAALGEFRPDTTAEVSKRDAGSKADAVLAENPYDARHLFFEGIERLISALQTIEPADLDRRSLDAFLVQLDRTLNQIAKIRKNKGKK